MRSAASRRKTHRTVAPQSDLGGMAHDAFVAQDRLACTANTVGVLEILADNEGVAPLSFIFHDFGPFTTNLPSPLR